MDIKDLYIYAYTHSPVRLDTEDDDYLLCFVLDKIQRRSGETLGLIQRAIDRHRLVEITNKLAIRIYLDKRMLKDPLPIDWLTDHLVPETIGSYRHFQTELDQIIQEPERTSPEFYHIPDALYRLTVSGIAS